MVYVLKTNIDVILLLTFAVQKPGRMKLTWENGSTHLLLLDIQPRSQGNFFDIKVHDLDVKIRKVTVLEVMQLQNHMSYYKTFHTWNLL